MATPVVTPAAPAAASAAGPAAAAAPAAAPATTATPATPAVATPAVAPATTATPAPDKFEGMSTEERIAATLKDRLEFDDKGNITNADEAVQHPEQVEEANKVEEPKPGEQVEQTAEEKAEGAAKEGTEDGEDYYAPNEGIAAKDLRAKIEADPALKSAIDKNPELRNQIFANARLAARIGEYETIFMSPAEAAVAAERHGTYSMLSGLLGSVDYAKPETGDAFARALIEQTYLRDEDGNVLKNDKGAPRTSGAVGRFIKGRFAVKLGGELDSLQSQLEDAQRRGDDDQIEEISRNMEHAQWVAARFGLRPTAGAEEDSLPEEVKREKAAIAERTKALDDRETAARQQQAQAFDEAVEVGTQKVFDAELEKYLAKASGLDEHNRAVTIRNIKVALSEAIDGNQFYADAYDRIMNAARVNGFTPKLQQKLITLNLETLREALRKGVAKPAVEAAGAHVIAKQAEADTAQAARESASRGDTRTAMGGVRPAGAMTTSQIRESIIADYKANHGGDRPDEPYILGEQLKRGFAERQSR